MNLDPMRQYPFSLNSDNFIINSAKCKFNYLSAGLEPRITGNSIVTTQYQNLPGYSSFEDLQISTTWSD
jgi:hypothetical protein